MIDPMITNGGNEIVKKAMLFAIALGIAQVPAIVMAEHVPGPNPGVDDVQTVFWADTTHDDAYGGTDLELGRGVTDPDGFYHTPIVRSSIERDQAFAHHGITFDGPGNYIIGGDVWVNGWYSGFPLTGASVVLWLDGNRDNVIGNSGDLRIDDTTVKPGGWYEFYPVSYVPGQPPLGVVVTTGVPQWGWTSFDGRLAYRW